jgi:hypothetical protein
MQKSNRSRLGIQRDVEEHDSIGFCFPLVVWSDLIIRLSVTDILNSVRSKWPCDLGNRGRFL